MDSPVSVPVPKIPPSNPPKAATGPRAELNLLGALPLALPLTTLDFGGLIAISKPSQLLVRKKEKLEERATEGRWPATGGATVIGATQKKQRGIVTCESRGVAEMDEV